MFWSRGSAFRQTITRIAGRTGGKILQIDSDSALVEFPGEYQAYTLAVGLVQGKVCFCTWSLIYWRGNAPPVIYGFMEQMDQDDRCVSFAVKTSDSGKTRCRASTIGPSLEKLDDELFEEVATTLISKIASVDSALRNRGYA